MDFADKRVLARDCFRLGQLIYHQQQYMMGVWLYEYMDEIELGDIKGTGHYWYLLNRIVSIKRTWLRAMESC